MNDDSLNEQQPIQEIDDNVGPIDNSVLNTPARQPRDLNQVIPTDKSTETYFQLNQPNTQQPDANVVLDVDGKAAPIKDTELTPSNTLQSLLGIEVEENQVSATSVYVVISIIIAVLVFVVFNVKRAEYINKLEQELENAKKGQISQL